MVVEIDQSRNLPDLFLFAFGKLYLKRRKLPSKSYIMSKATPPITGDGKTALYTAEYLSWPTSIGGLLFILSTKNTYIFYLASETNVRYKCKKLRSSNVYQLLRSLATMASGNIIQDLFYL